MRVRLHITLISALTRVPEVLGYWVLLMNYDVDVHRKSLHVLIYVGWCVILNISW